MIHSSHLIALSNAGFASGQLRTLFAAGSGQAWRESFRRGWGLPETGGNEG